MRDLPRGTSVVAPVYRSTATLPELVRRVRAVLEPEPFEVVLVDDGSPAETWEVVTGLAAADPSVVGLRLGRNAGQHAALLAGVRAARFATIVTLDDDLQNPPEEIPRLLAALEGQRLDLVYGFRAVQAGPRWRRSAGDAVRWALGRLTGLDLRHLSPFRAFRARIREAGSAATGPRVVLDAILQWGTDRVGHVEVAHHPRADGRSGYSLRRLVGFALDMVTGYSTRPLRATAWLGFSSATFGLGVLIYVVGRYLVTGTSVAGFPFLASTIALFSGAQLVALGVIGEYLARIHVRSLGQPTYVVAERVGADRDAGS
jgi:glycosyltransferase involved in cell wall biosynthesis